MTLACENAEDAEEKIYRYLSFSALRPESANCLAAAQNEVVAFRHRLGEEKYTDHGQ